MYIRWRELTLMKEKKQNILGGYSDWLHHLATVSQQQKQTIRNNEIFAHSRHITKTCQSRPALLITATESNSGKSSTS